MEVNLFDNLSGKRLMSLTSFSHVYNIKLIFEAPSTFFFLILFSFFFLIFFNFILLYNTVLVLPYINIHQPQVYMSSQSWNPSHLPPHIISLGHPSAPAPSILYPSSNLDWRFISYMILYMFQCHSPKSSHPLPLPESKSLFYTSVSLLLFLIQGYRYHLSKFHIYALVYCLGVFLSGLLHSV